MANDPSKLPDELKMLVEIFPYDAMSHAYDEYLTLVKRYMDMSFKLADALRDTFGEKATTFRKNPPTVEINYLEESKSVKKSTPWGPPVDKQKTRPMHVPKINLSNLHDPKETIVFVVGAGISKEVGFPLANDIKSKSYLKELGITLDDWCFESTHTFEEMMIKIYEEDEILFSQLLYHYEKVFLLAESRFLNATGVVQPKDWVHSVEHYFYFNALLKGFASTGKQVVVITFNHDLCIETLLLWEGFNYGTITNKMFSSSDYPGLPSFGYDIVILKMHGSFNFSHCESCKKIWCESDYVWDKCNKLRGWTCNNCWNQSAMNMYIPPLIKKDINPLKETWNDAEKFLNRAKKVFAIGYSMPFYDTHAHDLLANINPAAGFRLIDPCATSTAKNYSYIEVNDRKLLNIGFRDYILGTMRGDLMEYMHIPF